MDENLTRVDSGGNEKMKGEITKIDEFYVGFCFLFFGKEVEKK